jgi:fucose 4-O-acetylase-like acetyltransferase
MKRDTSFDAAKGLGVVLVMLGHLDLPFWLINSIYFFHMPLFVLISGYFHKARTLREVVNSTIRLYLAYLVYGVLFLIISWIISGNFDLNSLLTLILARPVSLWTIPHFGIFWFIIVLMIIRVISQLVKPNILTLFISLGLFFIVWYLQKKELNIADLPFAPAQVILLFPFYVFGFLIKEYLPLFKKTKWIIYLLFIILGGLSIVLADGNGSKIVNYHRLSLFNPIIAVLLAVFGSVTMIIFSGTIFQFKNLMNNTIIKIGEYSFIYFALHLFLFSLISSTLNLLNVANSLMTLTVKLLGTLLICKVAVIILQNLKKISPTAASLLLLK